MGWWLGWDECRREKLQVNGNVKSEFWRFVFRVSDFGCSSFGFWVLGFRALVSTGGRLFRLSWVCACFSGWWGMGRGMGGGRFTTACRISCSRWEGALCLSAIANLYGEKIKKMQINGKKHFPCISGAHVLSQKNKKIGRIHSEFWLAIYLQGLLR